MSVRFGLVFTVLDDVDDEASMASILDVEAPEIDATNSEDVGGLAGL